MIANFPFKHTHLTYPNPGLKSVTEELGYLNDLIPGGRKERLYHLQKTVANSIELEEDGLSTM